MHPQKTTNDSKKQTPTSSIQTQLQITLPEAMCSVRGYISMFSSNCCAFVIMWASHLSIPNQPTPNLCGSSELAQKYPRGNCRGHGPPTKGLITRGCPTRHRQTEQVRVAHNNSDVSSWKATPPFACQSLGELAWMMLAKQQPIKERQ